MQTALNVQDATHRITCTNLRFFFPPYLCRAAPPPPTPSHRLLALPDCHSVPLDYTRWDFIFNHSHCTQPLQSGICSVLCSLPLFNIINASPTGTNTELQINLFVTLKKQTKKKPWRTCMKSHFNVAIQYFFPCPAIFSPALLHFVSKHYAGKP